MQQINHLFWLQNLYFCIVSAVVWFVKKCGSCISFLQYFSTHLQTRPNLRLQPKTANECEDSNHEYRKIHWLYLIWQQSYMFFAKFTTRILITIKFKQIMPHLKNLDIIFIISFLFWLFVFFCVLGPCLRRRSICYEDNSNNTTIRRTTSFRTTFAETKV